jgi:inorganic pyrophosphatase
LHGLEGISPEVRAELEKFFVATDELEAKTLRFLGWKGPDEAKKAHPALPEGLQEREGLGRPP